MMLLDLPDELLTKIVTNHSSHQSDTNAISQTNRRLHLIANPYLYKSDAEFHHSWALCWAAETGRLATAKLALQHGADIDTRCRERSGATPTILAACNGHAILLKLLLDKGANVNAYNLFHEAALSLAAQEGNLEIVNVLLDHKDIQPDLADTSRQTPLFWASCNEHVQVVKRLLEREDVDINKQKEHGATPLITAISLGHFDIVDALFSREKELDPNCSISDGQTALMIASFIRYGAIVKRLLDMPRIQLSLQDNKGMNALSHAVKGKAQSIVEQLVIAGINVNHPNLDGITPLALAADLGLAGIAHLLLSHGADPTLLDARGWSPLHWAAQGGYGSVASVLLADERVRPGLASAVGTTPLHCASWDSHYGVIELLMDQDGIDVNCKDNAGWTPIIWAAFNGVEKVLALVLADPRVDVNAQARDGLTALCFAAKKGHIGAVRILLDHSGIEVAVVDTQGRTARDHARERGHDEIVTLLSSVEVEIDSSN